MGDHSDAVWVATVKADALLGLISDAYRVQLGARFDWEVSDEDVQVARSMLSKKRIEALVRRRRDVRTASAPPSDWDTATDLLAL